MTPRSKAPVFDVHRPFGSLCRGVEGDVLDVLITAHLSETGSTIAARSGRSKSEVWRALRHLEAVGVVHTQRDEGGTWHSLRADSPLTEALKRFTEIRWDVTTFVKQQTETWDPRPLSVTLGTTEWARRFGVGTVIVIVIPSSEHVHPGASKLGRLLRDRLGPSVHVITATAGEIVGVLRDAGIDPSDPWDTPTTIAGLPLSQLTQTVPGLIGGTGGI